MGAATDGVGTAVFPLRREPAAPERREPATPKRRGRGARLRWPALGLLALLPLVIILPTLLAGGASAPARGPAGPPPVESDGQVGAVVLRHWAVRRDPGNRGLDLGWARGGFAGQPVQVPSVLNAHPVQGAAGLRNFRGSVAWYQTRFLASRFAHYALRFESVNHQATVWVDGRELGSHIGTYLPFEYHFPAGRGPHTVVVRVDWRNPEAQSAEGFHRTWFNYGGINRAVTIRPLGPSQLQDPTLHTQLERSSDGSLEARVSIAVGIHNYAGPRQLTLTGALTHGAQTIPLRFAPRQLGGGRSTVATTTAVVPAPALWGPGHPSLYDLDLRIPGESAFRARVGLRALTWAGGRLLLNGQPLVMRGASIQEDAPDHGDALTSADQQRLVNGLLAIGANATRSQHPLDAGLLARLDAAGILVWQGVGPVDPAGDWTSRTPALMRQAERRVRLSVHQEQLHPSIVAWNLVNEVAGNGHPGGEARYVQDMARTLHATDPGRLVAVDLWGNHPPDVAGPLYRSVDAVGATNYLGWYEDTFAPASVLTAGIRTRLSALRHTFPNKVLIVSEFGAEANALNRPNQPGGFNFQSRLLGLHLQTYRTVPGLSGMLIWDLRDFAVTPTFAGGSIHHQVPDIRLLKGINQKGLYTYGGRPKPALAVVRRAFTAMAFAAGGSSGGAAG